MKAETRNFLGEVAVVAEQELGFPEREGKRRLLV